MTFDQLQALPAHHREMHRAAAVWRTSKAQARQHYNKADALNRAGLCGLGAASPIQQGL